MKKSLATRKLITSIMVTVTLVYFMAKSPSPKIIFVPFLICGIAMIGKCIAQILNKEKLAFIFGKIFVLGFFMFFIGFLAVAGYTSIRDKNYSRLLFLIPFCIIGTFMIKKKLLNKEQKKNGESFFTFAFIISALLIVIAFLAGIFFLITGIKEGNYGLIFGGVIFTSGSLAFVLAGLTIKGCFDKVKIDVLGLYAGVDIAVIGLGFLLLKYRESYSLIEMVKSFGLWIVIPIMMTAAGVFQIVKCLKNKSSDV